MNSRCGYQWLGSNIPTEASMGMKTVSSEVPEWLTQPLPTDHLNNHLSNFSIAGLSLSVETEFPISLWAKQFLAPLDIQSPDQIRRSWTVRVGENTRLLPKLVKFLQHSDLNVQRITKLWYKTVWQVDFNDSFSVCFRPSQGIIWIVDRSKSQLILVLSARTQYPMLEIATSLRSMIVAHLTEQDWHLFHAGAVEIAGETHLIIGNGGAGKTSLIIGLMAQGARFIANERILLKLKNGQVECLSFPMEIAVGLGTAAQYSELAYLVQNSELLMLPTRRFATSSIRKVNISNWYKLNDKIQLLAEEFTQALNAPQYSQGGVIAKVLVPSLNPGTPFKIDTIQGQELQEILEDNYLPQNRENHYPNWLPLGFDETPSSSPTAGTLLSTLNRISASRVHFFYGNAIQYRP